MFGKQLAAFALVRLGFLDQLLRFAVVGVGHLRLGQKEREFKRVGEQIERLDRTHHAFCACLELECLATDVVVIFPADLRQSPGVGDVRD